MNGLLMSTAVTPDHIMQVGKGFSASKTLHSDPDRRGTKGSS